MIFVERVPTKYSPNFEEHDSFLVLKDFPSNGSFESKTDFASIAESRVSESDFSVRVMQSFSMFFEKALKVAGF